MNKQTKFYIELIDLKNFYEKKLHSTRSIRYLHKMNVIEEIIKLYENS
jgi:hypothetical protein